MRRTLLIAVGLAACCLSGHQVETPGAPVIGAATATVQATIISAENCAACERYVEAVQKEMPPDGWIVRNANAKDAAIAHVVITKTHAAADKVQAFPTTIIRRNGREVDRIEGQISPTQLAKRINKQLKQ